MQQNVRIGWSYGSQFLTTGWYQAAPGGWGLEQLVANLSTAAPVLERVTTNLDPPTESGITPVYTLTDVAQLVFQDSTGLRVVLNIPALDPAILDTDGYNILFGPITTLVAGMIANCQSKGGRPIVSYIQGTRVQIPMPPVQRG